MNSVFCGEKSYYITHRVLEDTERIMSIRAKDEEECWEFVTEFGKTKIPRILIVDDSLPLRVQMNIGLSAAGYVRLYFLGLCRRDRIIGQLVFDRPFSSFILEWL